LTEAIIWLVVWVVLMFGVAWAIGAVLGLGFAAIVAASEQFWIAPVGVLVTWLAVVGWVIFAAVQVILQVISVVQLATA